MARMNDRETAWDAVHEALPAGWTVGPPTYDPGVPGWSVTAHSVAYSRRRPPQTVRGTGDSETAALRALDDRLRGVPQPNGSRMAERERLIRLAYVDGAESWSPENAGRGLTDREARDVRAPVTEGPAGSRTDRRGPGLARRRLRVRDEGWPADAVAKPRIGLRAGARTCRRAAGPVPRHAPCVRDALARRGRGDRRHLQDARSRRLL